MKTIELKSMPKSWNEVSMSQFRILEGMKKKYKSKEAYLIYCFLYFQGLKPTLYASVWKEILSRIPVLNHFVLMDGRKVDFLEHDFLHIGTAIPLWKQCYRYKGIREFLFGKRFWLQDQELLSFAKKIEFLTENCIITANPVAEKKLGRKVFKSYYTLLADIPWLEYNKCCMFYERFISTKNKVFFWKFMCVLYQMDSPEQAESCFDELEINVVLRFWEGCQNYFSKCFPHLFKKVNKKTEKSTNDAMKRESEITVFLSKQAYLGPDAVRKMLAYDALEYMEQNAVDCEQRRNEMEKLKRR